MMEIFFGTSKENRILIGTGKDMKECSKLMNKYIKDNNLYSAPYRRQWMYEGELIIDYGSYSTFFYIKDAEYTFMKSICNEEKEND